MPTIIEPSTYLFSRLPCPWFFNAFFFYNPLAYQQGHLLSSRNPCISTLQATLPSIKRGQPNVLLTTLCNDRIFHHCWSSGSFSDITNMMCWPICYSGSSFFPPLLIRNPQESTDMIWSGAWYNRGKWHEISLSTYLIYLCLLVLCGPLPEYIISTI